MCLPRNIWTSKNAILPGFLRAIAIATRTWSHWPLPLSWFFGSEMWNISVAHSWYPNTPAAASSYFHCVFVIYWSWLPHPFIRETVGRYKGDCSVSCWANKSSRGTPTETSRLICFCRMLSMFWIKELLLTLTNTMHSLYAGTVIWTNVDE